MSARWIVTVPGSEIEDVGAEFVRIERDGSLAFYATSGYRGLGERLLYAYAPGRWLTAERQPDD